MIDKSDLTFLQRCVELAEEALEAGDEPFGSILVSAEGKILFEDRNKVVTKEDPTRHPEFRIARWSTQHLNAKERAASTVYTSGEHCPMCSSAHAWAGLGRIVYASSSNQLTEWLSEFSDEKPPLNILSIPEIAPNIEVDGPVPELAKRVRELHRRFHS